MKESIPECEVAHVRDVSGGTNTRWVRVCSVDQAFGWIPIFWILKVIGVVGTSVQDGMESYKCDYCVVLPSAYERSDKEGVNSRPGFFGPGAKRSV